MSRATFTDIHGTFVSIPMNSIESIEYDNEVGRDSSNDIMTITLTNGKVLQCKEKDYTNNETF